MANEQNLIPNSERTPKELREQTRNAGIASGEARRRKRDLKKAFEALFEKTISKDKDGNEISGAEALALKQFEKALKGDTRAAEFCRDTSGQKPIEKTMSVDVDPDVMAEVERIVDENTKT